MSGKREKPAKQDAAKNENSGSESGDSNNNLTSDEVLAWMTTQQPATSPDIAFEPNNFSNPFSVLYGTSQGPASAPTMPFTNTTTSLLETFGVTVWVAMPPTNNNNNPTLITSAASPKSEDKAENNESNNNDSNEDQSQKDPLSEDQPASPELN